VSETLDYADVPTEIYSRLRDRILRGQMQIGDRIKIDAVAKEFGVSIIPVREALRILAADGLIDIQPRRSPIVSGLPPEEMLEIKRIRLALEPIALAAAVKRMDDDTIARCDVVLAQEDKHPDGTSMDTWEMVALNREFHLTLYAPCDMPRLLKVIADQYDGLIQCAHFLVIRDMGGGAEAGREHRAILDACRDRDADTAVERLTRHLEAAKSRLDRAIKSDVADT